MRMGRVRAAFFILPCQSKLVYSVGSVIYKNDSRMQIISRGEYDLAGRRALSVAPLIDEHFKNIV